MKKTGIEIIAEERERQIISEGWTATHDSLYRYGELAKAAACYANPDEVTVVKTDSVSVRIKRYSNWPFAQSWWKPRTDDSIEQRIKELSKAGALIAAEIDRLNRCNICQRCGKRESVTMNGDMNMCQSCSDKLDRDFDEEYR